MTITVPANISTSKAKLPRNYEEAKTAIASCYKIDECLNWADKAAALASYHRSKK
jgi:hypothetical protein